MNHTFSRKSLNHLSFELFQSTSKDPQPKKTNKPNNNKRQQYKQAIISGINYPSTSNSIFCHYNNFPSLSKCHSSTKLTKTQNHSHLSSKSLMSSTHDRHVSPSPQVISSKNRNDKSLSSTMQSTDERKELNKLKAELREKNDIIKSLNRTIESYQRDRALFNKEINNVKYQITGYKAENMRLKKDMQSLQYAYEELRYDKNRFFSKEVVSNKEDANMDEEYKPEEQSLSGICFTDKVKMEKTMMSNSTANLPTLDFGNIPVDNKKVQIAVLDNKNSVQNEDNYFDVQKCYIGLKHIPKGSHGFYHNNTNNNKSHNTSFNSSSHNNNKITFGKKTNKANNPLINKFAANFKK